MKTQPIFVAALAATASFACAPAAAPGGGMAEDLAYLAADAREGRGVGTAGLADAAGYVAERFRAVGLQPGGSDGYLQPFTIDASAPAAAHAGIGAEAVANVVGVRPGRGDLASEAIVVGAHFDHLGRGGFGSLDPDSNGVVHNGADDNGSGTVALIDLARRLGDRHADNVRTVVFVAFTAEELGLIGSAHYVDHPVVPNANTFAMINMDMVGRLGDGRLAAFGAETAEEFVPMLDSLNAAHGFDLAATGDGFGRSDQQSFFAKKIPVLHFFTGTHEDYHRTTDDPEKIDYDGLDRVTAFVTDATWALATRRDPLTFVDAAPPTTVTSGSGYGAYLGSIPDMTESPDGVRLTGVRAGSPADEAGLRAGDILIGMGDTRIANLYDMTDALRARRPGDRVVLRVRRDGEIVELRATLGRRGG